MSIKILYITYPFVLLLVVCMALLQGSVDLSFSDILNLFNSNIDNPQIKTILLDIRLPRIIMALILGMMLSTSGLITQTVFRNPIADPFIIGTAAAATFGAVLAYLFNLPQYMFGIVAFIVCILVSFLIFNLVGKQSYTNISKLLIIGIAISALLGAFTSFAVYLIGEDSFQIIIWTMGYLGGASWQQNIILIIPLVACMIFFYLRRYCLDALLTGDEECHSLGINVNSLKKQLLLTTSVLVAFSVAFTGMIGFIGLIVPHCLRIIGGSSNAKILPLVALWGGVFLLLCDTSARTILSPIEIPIGVITATLGAPFFLLLAIKMGNRIT